MARDIRIRIEGDDDGWKSVAKRTDDSIDSIEKKAAALGGKFTSAGKALLPLSAGLTAAGGIAVKFATQFNAGMANVATLIPGNIKRVNELKVTVQNLAIATGKSTDDLSNGLYQTISAFGDTADTAKILEINARAAAAGLAETTDAINLTSAVTKGYGDTSAAAVQQASDLALMTVRLGQTTFPELAASMGKVIPIAREMGVSQKDLFAVFATATGVTGTAAEVATQYRGILAGLANPTEALTGLISKQGFASGQAMLEQLGLVETMRLINQAAIDADVPFAKFLASQEAWPLAMALAGPQADNFAAKQRDLANSVGATDAAFKEQAEGVNAAGFRWEQMQQRMVVAAQRIGDKLMPMLERLGKWGESGMAWVEKAIGWFSDLPKPVQDTALAIAAIAAISAPTLMAIGIGLNAVSAGLAAVGITSSSAAVKGIGATLAMFGGPAAVAIAGVGAAFLVANNDMKSFQANVERNNAVAKDGALNLTGYGRSLQTIPPGVAAAMNAIGGLTLSLDQVPPPADKATGALGRVTEAAKKLTMTLPGVTLEGNVLAYFDAIEVRADNLIGNIVSVADSIRSLTGLVANIPLSLPPLQLPRMSLKDIELKDPSELAKSVQRWFDGVPVAETGLSLGQRAGKAIVSGLGGALDAVTSAVLGAIQGGGNVLEAGAAALGSKIGAGIGGGIGNFFGGPGGKIIGEKIGAFLGSFAGKLFAGNDTKKAREQAAQMLGFSSPDALYNELRAIGGDGAALVHQALNVIGKKDMAAHDTWLASVKTLLEAQKIAAGEAATAVEAAAQREQDAINATRDALQGKLDVLKAEHDQVFNSIRAELEAPEYDDAGNRIYGVIEAQGIARLEEIEKQKVALQEQMEAAGTKLLDTATLVRDGIAEMYRIPIEIPYSFTQVGPMPGLDGRTSYAASGGYVTPQGVHYFDSGGWVPRGSDTVKAMLTPGEMVLPPRSAGSFVRLMDRLSDMDRPGATGRGKVEIVFNRDVVIRDDRDIDALADAMILRLNDRGL